MTRHQKRKRARARKVNTVQTLTMQPPQGGTFTVHVGDCKGGTIGQLRVPMDVVPGSVTRPVPYNATAEELQAAIDELPRVGQ